MGVNAIDRGQHRHQQTIAFSVLFFMLKDWAALSRTLIGTRLNITTQSLPAALNDCAIFASIVVIGTNLICSLVCWMGDRSEVLFLLQLIASKIKQFLRGEEPRSCILPELVKCWTALPVIPVGAKPEVFSQSALLASEVWWMTSWEPVFDFDPIFCLHGFIPDRSNNLLTQKKFSPTTRQG